MSVVMIHVDKMVILVSDLVLLPVDSPRAMPQRAIVIMAVMIQIPK
jgi:hypothetical protein